ncbi:hypothetical protein B0H14DRAFT_3731045 [Mycena olivaceomarginata]|nr:hypothetical protein B0H14DRAFT_3731045 [Mycena olivaceomarginata]
MPLRLLRSQFSSVLGLALPADSIIVDEIPPQVDDTPDSARPGSDAVPSVLGIGPHPATLVPDPSKIAYDALYAPSPLGPLFWKTAVHGITRLHEYLAAVLDIGVHVILTTTDVVNAIYGAIGVQPAANNMYYLTCTTSLNLTFSLDDRDEIPIHPLDLSTPSGSNAPEPNSCIRLIQTSADVTLQNPTSVVGDMVLGPSVGIDVLIALSGFVGLCLLLFGLWWVFVHRSLRRGTDGHDNLSARDTKSSDHPALALGGVPARTAGPRGKAGDDPKEVIITVAERLQRLRDQNLNLTQLGIQFVQVGNDLWATKALKDLDDGLHRDDKGKKIPDIVDTTPYASLNPVTADGLIKVLLGGILRKIDAQTWSSLVDFHSE